MAGIHDAIWHGRILTPCVINRGVQASFPDAFQGREESAVPSTPGLTLCSASPREQEGGGLSDNCFK
jgi:hypothetical protein